MKSMTATEVPSKEPDHDNVQSSGSESTLSELSTPLTTNSPEALENYTEVDVNKHTPSEKWHVLSTLNDTQEEADLIDELIDIKPRHSEPSSGSSTPTAPTESSPEVSSAKYGSQLLNKESLESEAAKVLESSEHNKDDNRENNKENKDANIAWGMNNHPVNPKTAHESTTIQPPLSSVNPPKPKTNDNLWTPSEICTIFTLLLNDEYVIPSSIKGKSSKDVTKKVNELKIVAERQQHVANEGLEVYGDWSPIEISILIYLWNIDLTARRLALDLPEKSGLEVRGKLLQLNGSVRWTDPELLLVQEAVTTNQSLPEIARELPIRTIQLVKSKLSYYRNRTARDGKATTFRWLNQQLRKLNQLVVEDLTLSAMKRNFPEVPMEQVLLKLKEIGTKEDLKITEGEILLLKYHIESGNSKSLKDVSHEFPLRSIEFLENSFNNLVQESKLQEGSGSRNEAEEEEDEEDDNVTNNSRKKPEIEIRRKNFKNSIDELVYYAQWFASENFSGTGRRGDRRRKNLQIQQELQDLSKEATAIKPKVKIKRELTEEEIEVRRIKKQKLEEKRQADLELRKQQRLEGERRRQERIAMGLYKSNRNTAVMSLKSEAEYFQSVTGNHQEVKEGETRHRRQTEMFIPDFSVSKKSENRHRLKLRQKQLMKAKLKEQAAAKKRDLKRKKKLAQAKLNKKRGSKKEVKVTPDPEDDDEDEEEEEEEEEVKISAFDPYDINTDTQIPLFDRKFYLQEILSNKPLPDLKFNADTSMATSDALDIPLLDTSAIDVMTSFCKHYNDLPISFPPFSLNYGKGSIINPANKLSVRHLLYPDHCETYVLAEPKSNELDPIVEIQKLFQIHYALYFLYSTKIKEIIVDDYCRMLDEHVENNDFSSFLAVIDKWNMLMLKLTPNVSRVVPTHDINADIRKYAENDHIKVMEPDLKLDIFMEEIMSIEEPVSPEFERGGPDFKDESWKLVQEGSPLIPEIEVNEDLKLELIETQMSQCEFTSNPDKKIATEGEDNVSGDLETPNSFVGEYTSTFYKKLKLQQSVSRFCMQQILLRVYSRFVSPESNGLRSYKAFTAEVYGELLPSFVSEVLTKVDLRPSQKFYDLGSGVGNTTFQAALEFGATLSGGCELMEHASRLTLLQDQALKKYLKLFGLHEPKISWVLSQSFVENPEVRENIVDCDVIIVNNYLFGENLNADVGRLLYGVKPGTKIISLRNFIRPRYKSTGDLTIFDYFKVERHEMSDFLSVSWTANKVPYYISTVQEGICEEYLR